MGRVDDATLRGLYRNCRRPRLRLLRGLWPHPAGGRFLWSPLGRPAGRRLSRHGRGRKNRCLLRFAGSRQGCLRHEHGYPAKLGCLRTCGHTPRGSPSESFQRRIRQIVAEETTVQPRSHSIGRHGSRITARLMTSIPGYKQLWQMTRRPHSAFAHGERLRHIVRPKKRRSIFGILAMLKSLGLTSLTRRLAWLASCSFVSGLSQAALLVVVSELAVSSAQGGNRLKLHGLSLSLHDSVYICVLLLMLFSASSMAAAFAGSAMSSTAVEAGRAKVIDSFFNASWGIQSAEPLGHIQQLLTVNCENIGWVTLGLSGGVQALLLCNCPLDRRILRKPDHFERRSRGRNTAFDRYATLPQVESPGLNPAFE